MTTDQAIKRIQFAFPQIYYACHTRHPRRKSNAFHLSTRDSEILVHLDSAIPLTLGELARHLDLATSTLSEAISTLEGYGYVSKTEAADRRRVGLRLTVRGAEAVHATSVLDAARVAAVLKRMPATDRRKAIEGLSLFASACRRRSTKQGVMRD